MDTGDKKKLLLFLGATNSGKTSTASRFHCSRYNNYNFDDHYRRHRREHRLRSPFASCTKINRLIGNRIRENASMDAIYEGSQLLFPALLASILRACPDRHIKVVLFDLPLPALIQRLKKRIKSRKGATEKVILLSLSYLFLRLLKQRIIALAFEHRANILFINDPSMTVEEVFSLIERDQCSER